MCICGYMDPSLISLQCWHFLWVRAGYFCLRKHHAETPEERTPIFLCRKIKDGGYNNMNMNKLLPTQNTPILQANP